MPGTLEMPCRRLVSGSALGVLAFALAFVLHVDRDAEGRWRVAALGTAHAQIAISKARIGCLDIQTDGNMTGIVGAACNGKWTCSFKAPTEDAYKRMGVKARTRSFCTQGMEITYQCGHNDFHTATIAGDAWNNPPAQLACTPPKPPPPAHVPRPGLITVTGARIGCLDIQTDANMTGMVAGACDDKKKCSFKAPTEDEYKRAGVQARTRTFCTQAMEITYQCGHNDFHTVGVPGDAWKQPPALLDCDAPAPPPDPAPGRPDAIRVTRARIGCLDIQRDGNLTGIVGTACNDKRTCSYQAPTEDEYKRAGVHAATRSLCTQAMEITYNCGHGDPQTILVQGDAWKQPPARLVCNPPPLPAGHVFAPGTGAIRVTKARIGCLDIQTEPNLTALVAQSCNDRLSCSYQAPTEAAYKAAGVTARTRTLCSQGMEVSYRCGQNDEQVVKVDGDAWLHPPAQLVCDGKTIAGNSQGFTPPPQGSPTEPACHPPTVWVPDPGAATEYIVAPSAMLDWTPTQSTGDYTTTGFRPPQPATRNMYRGKPGDVQGAPGSTLGSNEGRVRAELRAVARKQDPLSALCQAAQKLTRNRPAPDRDTPSDHELGIAFADLSVTGKASFAAFVRAHPTAASLHGHAECAGASAAAIDAALDRAYQVAAALRLPHGSKQRAELHWIAVSGEDDQPYRPVNVPGTSFPQFHIRVETPQHITVNTRYLIAHRRPPSFPQPAAPLVDGGSPNRIVPADPAPALAPDAEVLLFIHGMDSRAEEAEDLIKALHGLPDHKNWTVVSLDLPTSGYADNLDPGRIGSADEVSCHQTKLLDFIEDFIVAYVDTLDRELHGQLKPRIRAVVGGSLGGNMAMRLGRRDDLARLAGRTPDTAWITHVIPWSPAAIWPSMIAQKNCVACGCDTGWDEAKDRAVNLALRWSGRSGGGERFLPRNETPELRRELFYGGFDWNGGLLVEIFSGKGHKAQAECWYSDRWRCKDASIAAARLDRQETYDANFRAWHWRLGAEQLAFSQRLNTRPGQSEYADPLYLHNKKPMLLFGGVEDACGSLCDNTRDVAGRMVNTPGYARFLNQTGHSLDNEHPNYVAREIAAFLQ